MTLTSGSSNGGGGNTDNKRDGYDPNKEKKNLSGSLSAGTIGTPSVAKAHGGSADKGDDGKAVINIRPTNTSIVSGASSEVPQAHMGSGNDNKTTTTPGAVDTTVTQKPAAGDGAEGTTVTNGPRSDFSVVLAGQVGKRPDRSAARSNNFISLVGGAGGLGRKTSQAKRSLIGGA
jgi:hypothetical protein